LKRNPVKAGLPVGDWWLIVECCTDLGRYYKEMLNRFNRGGFATQKPAWGAHISVIRGEEPTDKALWDTLDGKEVKFTYEDRLLTNDRHYWLPVQCEAVLDLRENLGLPREPKFDLHLTVAIRP
jgi:hypothetical protein